MIIKEFAVANGSIVGLHTVREITGVYPLDWLQVRVASYASEDAYLKGAGVAWEDAYRVPTNGLDTNGDMLGAIEQYLTTHPDSPFAGGSVTYDSSQTIEALKIRKRAEITRDRLKADADHFVFQGKKIRTNNKDMFDLLIADARWSKGQPQNWPGGWKADDDSYVPISTKELWDNFFVAMYDTGIGNFTHSQQLKSRLAAAETLEEVAAIKWGMPDA